MYVYVIKTFRKLWLIDLTEILTVGSRKLIRTSYLQIMEIVKDFGSGESQEDAWEHKTRDEESPVPNQANILY